MFKCKMMKHGAVIGTIITAPLVALAATNAWEKVVDFLFIKMGWEPLKAFVKNPKALIKKYFVFDPISGKTRKITKKVYLNLIENTPKTKKYVKTIGGATIFVIVASSIGVSVYDSIANRNNKIDPNKIFGSIHSLDEKIDKVVNHLSDDEDNDDDLSSLFDEDDSSSNK